MALLLSGCSKPEIKPVPVTPVSVIETKYVTSSLRSVLAPITGFTLGGTLTDAKKTELRICAAKMRYGNSPNNDVAQLFCSNRHRDPQNLRKFWVNFTPPDRGNKAWKINLVLPGDGNSNATLISKLTAEFGAPRQVNNPLSYKWAIGDAHLRLTEDQFGLQVELWDRSLHQIS